VWVFNCIVISHDKTNYRRGVHKSRATTPYATVAHNNYVTYAWNLSVLWLKEICLVACRFFGKFVHPLLQALCYIIWVWIWMDLE